MLLLRTRRRPTNEKRRPRREGGVLVFGRVPVTRQALHAVNRFGSTPFRPPLEYPQRALKQASG